MAAPHPVHRLGRTATVRVRGDVTIPTSPALYETLRNLQKRRDVSQIVVDFADAGRLDSSGVAAVDLVRRAMHHAGKQLELEHLAPHHHAALSLAPTFHARALRAEDVPTRLEVVADHVIAIASTTRELGVLVGQTLGQGAAIALRRRRLPGGAISTQILVMGVDAVFIVGLLGFLLGMTLAFQGAVQLMRFGAGPYVADMVGWSMARRSRPSSARCRSGSRSMRCARWV